MKQNRINRLKNLLLLLCRILILTVLILVFAQPFNTRNPFRIISGSNSALYCWIDPTISMSYTQESKPLWQHGCDHVAFIDSLIPTSSKIFLYHRKLEEFVPVRKGKLSDLRSETSIIVGHNETNFDAMIAAFMEYKKKESHAPVLVLISDFQEKDESRYTRFFQSTPLSFPVLCISMADKTHWNYSLYNPRITFEPTTVLHGEIKSKGRSLEAGEVVVLLEAMRTGHASANLSDNDSLSLSIEINQYSGDKGGRMELLSIDPFPLDNVCYFLPRTATGKRMLVIGEEEESFPINAAIRTIASKTWSAPKMKKPVEVTYADLDSSDIIILSSVKNPTEVLSLLTQETGLSEKVFLFSPTIGDGLHSFNSLVFRYFNSQTQATINGMSTTTNMQTKSTTQNPWYPLLPDTLSLLWRGFPRISDKSVAVYQYFQDIPGIPLVLLNNGKSLVTHLSDRVKNSWIIFASPCGITEANNVCETGFFIPLLDRVLRYGSNKIPHIDHYWIAGVWQKNPYSRSRTSAQVFTSEGKPVAVWDRQVQVNFDKPGLYRIQPDTGPAYWAAVNVDPTEGDLAYKEPNIPQENKKFVTMVPHSSVNDFMGQFNSSSYDVLWILLIVFMIIEVSLWKKKYPTLPDR